MNQAPPALDKFRTIKAFLLSRSTVLFLLLLLVGAVLLGNLFPQSAITPQAAVDNWQADHPQLAALAASLALDHIYTSRWFLVLLLIFSLSLILSTAEQIARARHKALAPDKRAAGGSGTIHCRPEQFVAILRQHGYRLAAGYADADRFVKHPWGYWGQTMLHLGMALVVAASLVFALTLKRGIITLAEDEVFAAGAAWPIEEKGFLAQPFFLPEAVRLEKVRPEFWPDGGLKQLAARIQFLGPDRQTTPYTLSVNNSITHRGTRVSLFRTFGTAFVVELTAGAGGQTQIRIDLEQPARPDQASYGNFSFPTIPFLIKAKYYADVERKLMQSDTPQLVLRLKAEGRTLAELPLTLGQSGRLGPYTAKLLQTDRWAGLIFSASSGMPLLYAGFLIIILGTGLTYFTPPREILVRRNENGLQLYWFPGRFKPFHHEELHKILEHARQAEKS